jgi:hypothetical protein
LGFGVVVRAGLLWSAAVAAALALWALLSRQRPMIATKKAKGKAAATAALPRQSPKGHPVEPPGIREDQGEGLLRMAGEAP